MKKILLMISLIMCFALESCKEQLTYHKTVEKELATGVRNDELFLGLSFGMSTEDFYETCWGLNKRGLTREGAMNTTVHYPLDEFREKGSLDFYPLFKDDKVQSMTASTQYAAWAPWRKDLWPEELIEDTRKMFENWYGGNSFFPIKSLGTGKAYIKIDGNRRIVLYYLNDQRVEVLFSDLTNLDEVLKLKKQE